MSDVSDGSNERKPYRRQRSIYQVHYGLERSNSVMTTLSRYTRQVAGHAGHASGDRYLGLLKCSDGTILKPILKESQRREIDFYERVNSSKRPDLVELRKFMPKYYGVGKFTYEGHEQEYIILEDLTEGMLEPCIMDIKIGRITYDPFATAEKIEREESKYARCKRQYSFCIPGYQLYDGEGGEPQRAGREQGKRLHGDQVVAALRAWCGVGGRALVLQVLSALWSLARLAARGGVLLRAASLLLAYDAARMRPRQGSTRRSPRPAPPIRRRSVAAPEAPGSSFSGQLSPSGPVYSRVSGSKPGPRAYPGSPPPVRSSWSEALERLDQIHSFDNNYENKLCKMKMNYRSLLGELSNDFGGADPCGTLKLIDFAHGFIDPDEDIRVDTNFKEGIDSLVRVFETLLKETDDLYF